MEMVKTLRAGSVTLVKAVTERLAETMAEGRNDDEGISCLTAKNPRATTTHSEEDDQADLISTDAKEIKGLQGGAATCSRLVAGSGAPPLRKVISRHVVTCILDDASAETGTD